jgi:hypothetical protein
MGHFGCGVDVWDRLVSAEPDYSEHHQPSDRFVLERFFDQLWHQMVGGVLTILSIFILKSGLSRAGVPSWMLLISYILLGSSVYVAFLYRKEKDGVLEEIKALSHRPLSIRDAGKEFQR